MAGTLLESGALSAFCGSTAVMLSAGIQTDEAVHMLADSREDSRFKSVCDQMYKSLIDGASFADAMRATGAFPAYAIELAEAGEASGRLEPVLRDLELYYDEEDRLFNKVTTSVGYPAGLLVIMAAILAVTVWGILPVFNGVYNNMTGSITAGSASAVSVSIVIGWIALVVTLICALVVVWLSVSVRSEEGRVGLMRRLAKFGPTKRAMNQLALSRFTVALATYVASGIPNEDAVDRARKTVNHDGLEAKLADVYAAMTNLENPRSLAQAISENDVLEPFYARMLTVGSMSGSIDGTLATLSETFFDDAIAQIDRAVNNIEPVLAAFLTVAVGATLVSVMLPLIGIMTSIG